MLASCYWLFITPWFVALAFSWQIFRKRRRQVGNNAQGNVAAADKNELNSVVMILRQRLDWAAYEAELAGLRSQAVSQRLSQIDMELSKIKESVRAALEISMDSNRKIENMGSRLDANTREARRTVGPGVHTATRLQESKPNGPLSATEKQVVGLFESGAQMTTREIRSRLMMSREHTSRLLGGLVERGVLIRRREGRQFIYEFNPHYS